MPTFVSGCMLFGAIIVAVIAAFVGWLSTTWLPEGYAFACLIPALAGMPPPPLWGPWKTPLTPPVPDDLKPKPRPAGEMFLTLPGGDSMPANGLGTCCRASAYDDESVRRSVLWYLLNGGRHIDTAQLYLNHKAIGRAIEQAIARGVPRAEMWVTTKLHERFYDRGQDAILKMVKEWMEELRVDYLDLVLLHQPKPLLVLGHTCKDWTQCARSAWRALAEAKNKGWAKNIGVSNFNIEQLKDLQALDVGSIAANQFMLNPWSPSWAFEIADYCQQHKIAVTVWAPLAGTTMQTKKAMSDPMIRNITANHSGSSGKRPSSAQVILRWALQKGYNIIPGSGNPKHQEDNLAIYSLELSGEEMAQIDSLRDNAAFMYAGNKPLNAAPSTHQA